MSGICGIIALDGAHPTAEQIAGMTAPLERRGPDGTHHWLGGPAALGHTLLATTPEALVEVLPLTDPATGCTITADVRLDNRDELIPALGLASETRVIGDGELILRAYLAWGEACLDHFLGDFAFAIWDPREERLFCGRDHIGMRQLIYCHVPGQVFAFATEPRAVLTHRDVPRRINEGRIADFLEWLEGIDFTSTFFEGILRLPPAHCLTLDAGGLSIRRYWTLEPGPMLQLDSDQAYADAFLEVFTKAVSCRLRSAGPVGAMLSGGMDSGSVVAVASRLLDGECRGPLDTFSAVGPDPDTCVETRTIDAACEVQGLRTHRLNLAELARDAPTLIELTKDIDEPFDGHMTLVRAVYLRAHQAGIKVMLDGVGGDLVMGDGGQVVHLLRKGELRQALREMRGLARFWGPVYRPVREIGSAVLRAYLPQHLRQFGRLLLQSWHKSSAPNRKLISAHFAREIDLPERQKAYASQAGPATNSPAQHRANGLIHTTLVCGRERYDRVAASLAIEPRDPFLDLRVIAFCLSLPSSQLLADGWPKIVLRRAMAGRLPDSVRWRVGKEHLGANFTKSLFSAWTGWSEELRSRIPMVACYVQQDFSAENSHYGSSELQLEARIELHHFVCWFKQTSTRMHREYGARVDAGTEKGLF